MSSRENGKPCAKVGSDEDHEDGRDTDADPAIKVVFQGTVGHCYVGASLKVIPGGSAVLSLRCGDSSKV